VKKGRLEKSFSELAAPRLSQRSMPAGCGLYMKNEPPWKRYAAVFAMEKYSDFRQYPSSCDFADNAETIYQQLQQR